MQDLRTAADFFAGIGLVSFALEKQGWQTSYAVDYSKEKQKIYRAHFGTKPYHLANVQDVRGADIPPVTLIHASFPCTDVSVAGSRGGINVGESVAFWEFVRILREMLELRKLPPLLMLENVEGLLTSGGGKDLAEILQLLNSIGYTVDLLLIDAAYFVPQSRVRLFVIGSLHNQPLNSLAQEFALNDSSDARPKKIADFIRANPQIRWSIRNLPMLPERVLQLEDVIDSSAQWWSRDRADYLFSQMFERHQQIIHRMMAADRWSYGTVFRRMRQRDGIKQSTAELRTDGLAGCLRTPKGGSARQILVRAGNGQFDVRLINEIESARLMGAEDYILPATLSLNEALFGFGDAVCVPAIEWIAKHYLNPMLNEMVEVDTLRGQQPDKSTPLPESASRSFPVS
ncbi:DNA cytosine methyltransferase [Leptolyngbya sp. AN03gr2]|uniref:DNA cytosine methyltransferase n=1 Tax=unclassified Leptolyngbya TaxID=2650499 RepID=UPI003D31FE3D